MSITLHGSCVVLGEAGILILGESGAGKSRLAAGLCEEMRRRGGFAALVGDDRVLIHASSGRLIAQPHPVIAGLIEARGIGLVRHAHEPSARLRLVIALGSIPAVRLPEVVPQRVLCGISLPELPLIRGTAAQDAMLSMGQFARRVRFEPPFWPLR